jgi:hypothetical protein
MQEWHGQWPYCLQVWLGKEYVLETCKDGRHVLSNLVRLLQLSRAILTHPAADVCPDAGIAVRCMPSALGCHFLCTLHALAGPLLWLCGRNVSGSIFDTWIPTI